MTNGGKAKESDKEDKKWRDIWSFRLGVVGSILGAIGTVFGGVQWYDTGRQSRITAAVEISKSHVADKENEDALNLLLESMDSTAKPPIKKDVQRAFRFVRKLNYIAFLANKEKLNEDYISDELKCDMHVANTILEEAYKQGAISNDIVIFKDITIFDRNHRKVACEELNPKSRPQSN